jgi:hypothetical protein
MLAELASQPARLRPEIAALSPSDRLKHFRTRNVPRFLPGFEMMGGPGLPAEAGASFSEHNRQLIAAAERITKERRWPLLGLAPQELATAATLPANSRLASDSINWQRDPLTGRIWPLNYHADIALWHDDGSDVRVLWELNRLGQLVTLGQAYALTRDEKFAGEFFGQVESWYQQNPLGRGANWSCAMEVALRAMNLLAAFSLFRSSSLLSEKTLALLLLMFDQHGAHLKRNLEFSYVGTSNHYLSDVTGLLWLGLMLPELSAASGWREWALAELLGELDKQVLADGAHYEGSTGYHRFVLELFLYSFVLCLANEIPIADKYWRQLRGMLVYLKAILRPDGAAPLLGDSDGGQVLSLAARRADDHAYLLALGAVVFNDSEFKTGSSPTPPELLWVLGSAGLQRYQQLASSPESSSQGFAEAGVYVLRQDDLYLLCHANGARKDRPASHRHNDALSIEVSAGGRPFIVDPGSYVYTADLHARHLFRSTAYHSTLQLDNAEQNTIWEAAPFVIGAEARVSVSAWQASPERDQISAEHNGYERLPEPARHRRTVTFFKPERWWLIEDELIGAGEHEVVVRFHFASGLAVSEFAGNRVMARDELTGASLLIASLDLDQPARMEPQFTSQHYGWKEPSLSAGWTTRKQLPVTLRWAIVPVRAGEEPVDVLARTQRQNLKAQS